MDLTAAIIECAKDACSGRDNRGPAARRRTGARHRHRRPVLRRATEPDVARTQSARSAPGGRRRTLGRRRRMLLSSARQANDDKAATEHAQAGRRRVSSRSGAIQVAVFKSIFRTKSLDDGTATRGRGAVTRVKKPIGVAIFPRVAGHPFIGVRGDGRTVSTFRDRARWSGPMPCRLCVRSLRKIDDRRGRVIVTITIGANAGKRGDKKSGNTLRRHAHRP
jgi:hypothetical protein